MLVFTSVSNSLRLNKHVHIRALTTSMATQEMLGTVGRDAVQSLDPIESSAPFWSCSLRGESVKLWICSFHLQPDLCNGMLCNCMELIFNDPQQYIQRPSTTGPDLHDLLIGKVFFKPHWEFGVQMADRRWSGRWHQTFWRRVAGNSKEPTLLTTRWPRRNSWTRHLDGKQREMKYGLVWCWYRLWMDGLNGLLRNSSWNINKIMHLASFPIQQEQYCYIWHHLNMFEMKWINVTKWYKMSKNTWLRAQNLRWDPCWVKMLVHWDGILRIISDDLMKPQRTPLVVSPRNSLFPCFTTTKNPFIGYGFCMFKGIPVVTVVWKYLNDSSRRFQVLEKPCRMCLIVLDSLSNLGLPQDHLNLLHWKTNLYEDGTTHLGMLGGQVLNGRSQVFSCLMFLVTICKAEACLLRCQGSS